MCCNSSLRFASSFLSHGQNQIHNFCPEWVQTYYTPLLPIVSVFCSFALIAPCLVVYAYFAHTTSLCSSPSSKILARCQLIDVLSTSNKSTIFFCVSQNVSSSKRISIFTSLLGVVYNIISDSFMFYSYA